ncbi:hypothetical protein DFH09DRAFT_1283378 [Mycena vulgaris]|nr:hypothetical protein DFH09DRAFT_1283378 [Mycena vulgaris]
MFSIIRKMLAIGKSLATGYIARATDLDAPLVASPTRQTTWTTWTAESLKGMATCHTKSLLVTVHVVPRALTALALILHKDPDAVPVFVATHITDGDDDLAFDSPETPGAQDSLSANEDDASERVDEADEDSCTRAGETAANTQGQVWCDENDAHEEILQNLGAYGNTAIMKPPIDTADLLAALYNEPGAVVWESEVLDVPHIAFTPADESWEEFAGRCSNQTNQQWVGSYLRVPPVISEYSPYGPTPKFEPTVTVFRHSLFAASVSRLSSQTLYQRLDAYKAVAYVACLVGFSAREYYEHPSVVAALDNLYVVSRWTDPAGLHLDYWRKCYMTSIYESDHPDKVPHIVVTSALPNPPWEAESGLVPEQDERALTVPMWTYMTELEEQEQEDDDKWYCGDDEEEVISGTATWSESEEESDAARTPSPPSWPTRRVFPTSTGRRGSALDDLFEEDEEEDEGEVPSVRETPFRRPWLQDDDDEDVPPPATGSFSSRFNFSTTLSDIGERTPEDVYRPLAVGYKSLWSGTAMYASSKGGDLGDDQSHYTDALEDSETDQSQYVDVSQHEDQSEDDYGYRARLVPRPSCDIFLNDEDGEGPQLPRGKANIPAGRVDWFDLLDDDDLGTLDWPAARTTAAGT